MITSPPAVQAQIAIFNGPPRVFEIVSLGVFVAATVAQLAIAGPMNVYITALGRTVEETVSILKLKLAPFVGLDPVAEIAPFTRDLREVSSVTFLGAAPHDIDRDYIFGLFADSFPSQHGNIVVPFSAMVASCLSTTIYMALYIFVIGLSMIRLLAGNIVSRLNSILTFESAPFSILWVAVIATGTAISAALNVIGWIWDKLLV